MMRDSVKVAIDAIKEREVPASLGIAIHERRDARGVRPERQQQDVQHEPNMLPVVIGNPPWRSVDADVTFVHPARLRVHCSLDALLNGPHGLHILVELHLVASAALVAHGAGLL